MYVNVINFLSYLTPSENPTDIVTAYCTRCQRTHLPPCRATLCDTCRTWHLPSLQWCDNCQRCGNHTTGNCHLQSTGQVQVTRSGNEYHFNFPAPPTGRSAEYYSRWYLDGVAQAFQMTRSGARPTGISKKRKKRPKNNPGHDRNRNCNPKDPETVPKDGEDDGDLGGNRQGLPTDQNEAVVH